MRAEPVLPPAILNVFEPRIERALFARRSTTLPLQVVVVGGQTIGMLTRPSVGTPIRELRRRSGTCAFRVRKLVARLTVRPPGPTATSRA